MSAYWEDAFKNYENQYISILEYLWPAKGSTGFTERNLTCHFSKAYEKVAQENGQDAYTWFEFQFGTKSDQHYDAVIVNPSDKKVIIIESKRFTSSLSKVRAINTDIKRIMEFPSVLHSEYERKEVEGIRIYDFDKYEVWGLVLADVWDEKQGNTKRDKRGQIADEFMKRTFIESEDEIKIKQSALPELQYNYISFAKQKHAQNYRLLSFYWKVRGAVM